MAFFFSFSFSFTLFVFRGRCAGRGTKESCAAAEASTVSTLFLASIRIVMTCACTRRNIVLAYLGNCCRLRRTRDIPSLEMADTLDWLVISPALADKVLQAMVMLKCRGGLFKVGQFGPGF
jgi:hypothetical protein